VTGAVTIERAPLARRILRASLRLVRPIIAFNYVAGAPTRLAAGVPDDASHGLIEGPRPLHLLVVGGLSGSSVGVRSFELGVAHQFAKSLARSTGRGVEWESLATDRPRLAATAASIRSLEGLGSFDFIVLSPGTTDVLSFASLRLWRQEIERLVIFLAEKTSPRALIVVTRIPDVSNYVQVGPMLSEILSDDSRRFSAAAADACARTPKTEFVELPLVEKSDFLNGAFSYTALYRRWGVFLASVATVHLG
jgi:hypothetical protein